MILAQPELDGQTCEFVTYICHHISPLAVEALVHKVLIPSPELLSNLFLLNFLQFFTDTHLNNAMPAEWLAILQLRLLTYKWYLSDHVCANNL